MPSNYDPASGTELPPQYASPQYPSPPPDLLSSLLPSRYGHAPARSTPAAASLAPAAAPHPSSARNRPVSAAYSSENSQRSAVKPPSPNLSSVPQPAQTERAVAPSPPAPAPESAP